MLNSFSITCCRGVKLDSLAVSSCAAMEMALSWRVLDAMLAVEGVATWASAG